MSGMPADANEQQLPVVPPGASLRADIVYAPRADGDDVRLDLYLPPVSTPKPTIIWFHGGGWATGSRKEWVHPLFLVDHGFAVASIEYRFSDRATFPAQLLDCKAAIRYLRSNAALFGLDPKKFVAMGESAGGHLALLVATTGDDPTYADHGAPSTSDAVQAVIDVCGPTDLTTTPDTGPYDSAPYYIEKLLGNRPSLCPDLARLASPVFHTSARTPPAFIMHATGDPICPISQSLELHDALRNSGVPCEFVAIPIDAHVGPFFWTEERRRQMLDFLHVVLRISPQT
ncbi:MAG TPA: alpha/beta hydrolase [Capsulimonadaceae bacterium]|jgi:acetyl esterase/lipase